MAGRNRFKLIELQRELAAEFGPAASTPSSPSAISMVVASLDDKATIDAMVSEAQVVVNLVAPYTTTGTPIVDACVRLGTHYVDLAG